jgi:RNA polymerase sigma-70 factor (ECF subfamily)
VSFPSRVAELELHERMLAGDPTAPVDAFTSFADAITRRLVERLGVRADPDAYDSAVDAIYQYLDKPDAYDTTRGRLSTYLLTIAMRRAVDRMRSERARARRDEVFGSLVELLGPAPKEVMETAVMASELWPEVVKALPDPRDQRALNAILAGERSTEELAEALEMTALPEAERRVRVKQHRDRILKVLERLGARDDGP